MANSLLTVDALSVALPVGGHLSDVLSKVSFAVAEGEAVGLVGESGSGKSLTARAIARLLPAGATCEGRIDFRGQNVMDLSQDALARHRRDEVQMIFQNPRAHLNRLLTVGDFLTEALRRNRGIARRAAEKQVLPLLERLCVDSPKDRMYQYPHELSGGLLQRVMIAAALVVEPRLLIADEPTTALDVTTQAEVVGLLKELARERNLSLLFITHDIDLALAICERIVVMYGGTVVEDSPAELVHQPRHPYTAALLESRPPLSARSHRLVAIPGQPISALEAPPGCPFAPRCKFKIGDCEEVRPALRELHGAAVACSRAEDLVMTAGYEGAARE